MSLEQCKPPTYLDLPLELTVDAVNLPDRYNPVGAKGVGEPPTVVSTAAVLSALRAATGRELARVPVQPDDIVGL